MKDKDFIYVNIDSSFYNKIFKCSDFKVLFCLFKESFVFSPSFVYGNKFFINSYSIDRIIELTGKSSGTIRNSICSLSKSGFIFRDFRYRGVYYLNPVYFFKGKLNQRKKCISACIESGFLS